MSGRSRALVLGGSGQLGSALLDLLRARGVEPIAPDPDELDLSGPGAVASVFDRLRPTIVYNAAAYTDVTQAEAPQERRIVWRMNRDVPGELAALCGAHGTPLVHVSTDYVFDGRSRRPYLESDPTEPLQVYGRSKLAGEIAVLESDAPAIVVRTSTVFGFSKTGRGNFVDAILRQARAGAPLAVVHEPVSSPTSAADLAQAIVELAAVDARGLVHFANAGSCGRLGLAREAVRCAGLAQAAPVAERSPDPDSRPHRPAYSVLDAGLYSRLTGLRPRGWEEALAEYVART